MATSSSSSSALESTTSSTSTTSTGASSSATSSLAATTSSITKSSILIGPVVGGVLGGLVVLALFGLGALFILKKYGKKPQSTPTSELAFNSTKGDGGGGGGGEPMQPVEMPATWKADIPAEPYRAQPPRPFSSQTLYQPVIAEMPAGEEYRYEKGAHQSGVLEVPSPDVSVVSPASTNNRHSMGLPESLRYTDPHNGPRSA